MDAAATDVTDVTDAIDVAALVLGFDRERFPGDVDVALAAAVLLFVSSIGVGDDERTVAAASGRGIRHPGRRRRPRGALEGRSRLVRAPGTPARHRRMERRRRRRRGAARGDRGEEQRRGVRRRGEPSWSPGRAGSKHTGYNIEGYVDDVCAAVGAAGAVDAILCAGRCDDAVAQALASRLGVRAVIQNLGDIISVGRRKLRTGASSRWPRCDPRAVRDLRECTSGSAVEMCLDASARGGWDPDERRSALREGSVTYLSATYLETPRLVTAVLCHPVREVAEARVREVGRLVRRVRRTLANGGRVVPGGGVAELVAAASLTAELVEEPRSVSSRGCSEERVVRRALAWEAFAQSARELCHIASQNHGVPYDEASTRAARAEGLCAEMAARRLGSNVGSKRTLWAEASRVLGDESGRLRLEPVDGDGVGRGDGYHATRPRPVA